MQRGKVRRKAPHQKELKDIAAVSIKMGLRWWRDVLIRSQPKQYLDDPQARKYWLVSFGRLGNGLITGLKIPCPQGRAGSTPALGTTNRIKQLRAVSE